MSSNNEILTALDTIDEALRTIARQPLNQLRPADQRAVLLRVEEAEKQLATFDRRVLRTLVTGPMPVQFGTVPGPRCWRAGCAFRSVKLSSASPRRCTTNPGARDRADQVTVLTR